MDPSHIEKHVEISDRATLMNVLLMSDAYTVGTGIMPSALNRGDIVSIPFESKDYYNIGYLLNENKKLTPVAQRFIQLLEQVLSHIGK
jgi:hypothetical protein